MKTPDDIRACKSGNVPLVCLTAYSAPMAEILDKHCDVLLVGDSVGTALYGMENTLGVTLEMMIAHGKAVMRAARQACVVVDMPYGTYETSPGFAYENAARIMDETGCAAVKLEGGEVMEGTIAHLTKQGIPVMGHIGLQPQSVEIEGGYKIKGKSNAEISKLLGDAQAVARAEAFSVVIEGTIEDVARNITQSIQIPTIGIGASAACDGQILVCEDMLGMITDHVPKFVKPYARLAQTIDAAAADYAREVKARIFPDSNYVYTVKK